MDNNNKLKTYEFISDAGVREYIIIRVHATNEKDAIVKYCMLHEFAPVKIKAISGLSFDECMQIVNYWLPHEIVSVHEIANILYENEKFCETE